jgi:hypothetical protein
LERLFSDIRHVVLDPESDHWAVLFTGEGHPDVGVYVGEKLLFGLNIHFDGWGDPLRWQDGKLYVLTDAPLDYAYGLPQWKAYERACIAEKYQPTRIFQLDPKSQKAKSVNIPPYDITNTSFDGKYYAVIENRQDKTLLKIY